MLERFQNLPTAALLNELHENAHLALQRQEAFENAVRTPQGLRDCPIVVFDTNVLLDFWLFDDAFARPWRNALYEAQLFAVRSEATLDELADVISRDKFDLSFDKQCEILRLWHRLSICVEPTDFSPVKCLDSDDQKFLDLALSAKADFLVSKDKLVAKAARKLQPWGIRYCNTQNEPFQQ